MQHLFHYNDYRQFLRDYYEEQKTQNEFFSFRYLGQRLAMDAGSIQRITQGKAHLSQGSLSKFVAFLQFSPREADYFETLVHHNKARSKGEIQRLHHELQRLRDLEITHLSDLHYIYFSQWYHAAIRALIGLGGIRDDYTQLSKCLTPPITPLQAKQSVELLSHLDLIEKIADGTWVMRDKVLSTGGKWESLAIQQYQQNTIAMAGQSLERHRKEQRDISTLTLAIREEHLPLYRQRCAEFRRELMKMAVEGEHPDSIFQVNIQIFPLGYKDHA